MIYNSPPNFLKYTYIHYMNEKNNTTCHTEGKYLLQDCNRGYNLDLLTFMQHCRSVWLSKQITLTFKNRLRQLHNHC